MTTKATIFLPQTYTKDEKLQQPGKTRFIFGFIALTFSTILIFRSRRALVPDVMITNLEWHSTSRSRMGRSISRCITPLLSLITCKYGLLTIDQQVWLVSSRRVRPRPRAFPSLALQAAHREGLLPVSSIHGPLHAVNV